MELTLKFIEDNFDVINELYFNNELLKPRFEITHVKSYLGQYQWVYSYDNRIFYDSVIRISDMFDRSDDDIVNTLAHECIHLYIRQNKIRDTRPHHGRVFNQIADRLNREGGFHIARTDSVEGCGLRDKSKINTFYVANFLSGNCGKYFSFVINNNYIDYYIEHFKRYPSHYKKAIIFKSTDDKAYAHYRKCRGGVRGFYIEKEQYELNKECEEIIYITETLGLAHSAA